MRLAGDEGVEGNHAADGSSEPVEQLTAGARGYFRGVTLGNFKSLPGSDPD